jgi:hypothetical protein
VWHRVTGTTVGSHAEPVCGLSSTEVRGIVFTVKRYSGKGYYFVDIASRSVRFAKGYTVPVTMQVDNGIARQTA